jgi:hypothetical protein
VTTLAGRIQSDLVGLTVWEAAAIGLLLIRWIGAHVAEGKANAVKRIQPDPTQLKGGKAC